MAIICKLNLDELVKWFTGESHQGNTPLEVKVMMYLFIFQSIKGGIIKGGGHILQWPSQQKQVHPHKVDGA